MEATPAVDAPISAWRDGFERLCARFDIPADAHIEHVDMNGVHALRVAMPGAVRKHVILHFHSGGYVMGSSAGYRNFACRLSAATGATVLVPDYRLAPEHPYPAAVEDAKVAYRWTLEHYPASHVIVSGDSAGGGLAMATLLAARDTGTILPAAGIAISPLLDLAGEGESMRTNATSDPLIDHDMVVGMGKVYIGDIDPHEHPYASPLWAQHHGLPPLLLLASGAEVLSDDAARFAASATRAGVDAKLWLAPGMVHIWTLFPFLQAATLSMKLIGDFSRRHLPA